jgi:hypothetical protein
MIHEHDIFIEQGSDYSTSFVVTDAENVDVDLTGASFLAKFKRDYTSTTVYPFTCTLDETNHSKVTLSISAVDCASIPAGRYWYDAVYIANEGSTVVKFAKGIVVINPTVSAISYG